MAASHARFAAAVDAFTQLAKRMMALSDPNPQFGPYSASQWDHPLMRPFREQIQAMDLDRLLGVSRNAPDTGSALQHYIRGFGDDEQRLAKAFEPAMPFCLPHDVLVGQYNRTTAHAVAHSAALMADWFESLYAPGENCGVGLWQNADADDMASDGLPLDYGTPRTDKVAIILTDGVNQNYVCTTDCGASGNTIPDYSAYGMAAENRLGLTNPNSATQWAQKLDQRMLEICTAMKARDIILYTITFQVSSQSVKTLFRTCASDPAKYFDDGTSADLSDTFRRIAEELRRLRLAE
jgi:hypothetical protein